MSMVVDVNESTSRPSQEQIEDAVTTTLVGWGREFDMFQKFWWMDWRKMVGDVGDVGDVVGGAAHAPELAASNEVDGALAAQRTVLREKPSAGALRIERLIEQARMSSSGDGSSSTRRSVGSGSSSS